jgi:hypothetical protein
MQAIRVIPSPACISFLSSDMCGLCKVHSDHVLVCLSVCSASLCSSGAEALGLSSRSIQTCLPSQHPSFDSACAQAIDASLKGARSEYPRNRCGSRERGCAVADSRVSSLRCAGVLTTAWSGSPFAALCCAFAHIAPAARTSFAAHTYGQDTRRTQRCFGGPPCWPRALGLPEPLISSVPARRKSEVPPGRRNEARAAATQAQACFSLHGAAAMGCARAYLQRLQASAFVRGSLRSARRACSVHCAWSSASAAHPPACRTSWLAKDDAMDGSETRVGRRIQRRMG